MDRSLRRAWVAWNPVDSNYSGYVASLDEDGGEVAQVADAPDGLSFDQIIEWATEQAAKVFIRPHWDSGTTYWAGDGDHTAHPILDRSRAGEAADRVGEGETVIAGVIANCAHCAWRGTFANQAELIGAYAAHAHEAHGAARP